MEGQDQGQVEPAGGIVGPDPGADPEFPGPGLEAEAEIQVAVIFAEQDFARFQCQDAEHAELLPAPERGRG